MEFNLEDPFTCLNQHEFDSITALFSAEFDHMSSHGFAQSLKTSDILASFRQEAIALFFQMQYSCNFDPFTTYLAVNYMDRFISRKDIAQCKPWILRLLVISCLSLAAKMREKDFSSLDFQKEGFIFDIQTIQRMELLILDALNWRMRSITPFSFLCFFMSLFKLKDPPFTQALKARATSIIFKTQMEINLFAFKPSTMAASALLLASHDLFPLQFPSFKSSIFSCEYVYKENLLTCFNAMQEMVINEGNESALDSVSSTGTPLSILEWPCRKAESQSTTTTTSATVMPGNRESKQRKINGFCSESNRVQTSQIQQ
ncbi:hypothetical protein SLEP1_g39641 [Rubroshorea leprosula]|uniref:B-like cyclin n=1 Tax=Rubroshorea leprosula TaxID=152421 RepID=A0AAV5L122_9ROSI|nr:hypothetical protein SLEP1_g39641 [Rubroshorea leprosula]